MQFIDWAIVTIFLVFSVAIAFYIRKFTKSVTDFLAAGRCAGRYMLTISEGAAGLGSISILAFFEQYYAAGFCPVWWNWLITAVMIILALSGMVIYRYRQTRAMTMAQFFEMRYSRNFRVYAGLIAYLSGILNFAIFPAVGTRFFIYFCGMPETFSVLGIQVSTFAILMFFLLALALYFTFIGGQIAVMVTDFFQGLFTFSVFVVLIILCLSIFSWHQISQALLQAPPKMSLVNPFDTAKVQDFNLWFYLILAFGTVYSYKSWQGNQGYNCSARNPHEARMGGILGSWRTQLIYLVVTIIPICAYTFLNHPDFHDKAVQVRQAINQIHDPQIRTQMTVPVAASFFLPVGAMGLLCGIMLAAFISNHDTYLHTWGTLFVQDVVLPLRKKPLTTEQHLKLLKLSILGVACFIYVFSLLYRQSQYILLYLAITGAVFTGGAGACILGGLYWKRGTTAAAWTAMIVGPILAITGMILRTTYPGFPINEQWMWFITIVVCASLYVLVSLFGKKQVCNMDKLLHRGEYAVKEDSAQPAAAAADMPRLYKLLGLTSEFSRSDRFVYLSTFFWAIGWSVVFLIGTVYGLIVGIKPTTWLLIWKSYLIIGIIIAIVFISIVAIGGIRDIAYMFATLKTRVRDHDDTGVVHSSSEKPAEQSKVNV